jgi:hypothetical protein
MDTVLFIYLFIYLLFVCLAALSFKNCTTSQNRLNRKNELKRIWKEMVLICTWHTPEEAANPAYTHKKLVLRSRIKLST